MNDNEDTLTWYNVGIATQFLIVLAILSHYLKLQLERSLIISSVRCVLQLTLMGAVLEDVFRKEDPYTTTLIVAILILLSSVEIVYHKSNLTYKGMFLSVLVSIGTSTIAISIIGTKFGLSETPFWKPTKFIPTVGMIVSNCMSATAIAISACLSSFRLRRDIIETRLSYGASRWEAARSIAVESVRVAMLPTINGMSILGLISIPGMMTGQIMAGASVFQAAMYQQIMMFMISACSAFSVLYCVAVSVLGSSFNN
ncbi:hypothetical protein INT43_003936 [Umbelopsis isabellina]|uniref:Uncharacterized protein n=1 Tax=Mortierella isabellina TaxID=91625 RepID=A0A8H7PUK8_MORIS|nr:hypothetical protein INT43_003936 [Umbelopsis isabellina]